ncbi:MAG: hypothetical protein IKS10_08120 [Lachnospiraceae bacterium]|nr:hypothetical protein [Lachnospiraceae bacterium]
MNEEDSGLAHGTSGSPQQTLDNMDMETKAKENEKAVSEEQTDSVFSSFPKTILEGRQAKHISGSNNYTAGRSKVTLSISQLQELILSHSGKGQPVTSRKERVDFGTVIGVYVDQSTGKSYPTIIGIIHYANEGTHVIPARPKGGI